MPDDTLTPDWDTITDFVSDTLSSEDRRRFEMRLATDPVLASQVSRIQSALAAIEPLGPDLVSPAEVDRLYERLDIHSKKSHIASRYRNTSSPWRQRSIVWAGTCGIAVFGIVALVFGVYGRSPIRTPEHVYSTKPGQTATMHLDDGTRISMGPETRITVANAYGGTHRTVRLTGEAFFEVPTSSGVPFIVQTGGITTRVLGTAFSVRRYANDDGAQVRVQTGRVMASGRQASITVSAGLTARVTDSMAVTVREEPIYTDWSSGQLVFRNAKISDMLTAVGRWYGYQFRLTDSSLAGRHATITFAPGDAAEMLLALRALLDVELVYRDGKDSVVTLVPAHRRGMPRRSLERQDFFKPSMEMGR